LPDVNAAPQATTPKMDIITFVFFAWATHILVYRDIIQRYLADSEFDNSPVFLVRFPRDGYQLPTDSPACNFRRRPTLRINSRNA
jgi:hypothetical protein